MNKATDKQKFTFSLSLAENCRQSIDGIFFSRSFSSSVPLRTSSWSVRWRTSFIWCPPHIESPLIIQWEMFSRRVVERLTDQGEPSSIVSFSIWWRIVCISLFLFASDFLGGIRSVLLLHIILIHAELSALVVTNLSSLWIITSFQNAWRFMVFSRLANINICTHFTLIFFLCKLPTYFHHFLSPLFFVLL